MASTCFCGCGREIKGIRPTANNVVAGEMSDDLAVLRGALDKGEAGAHADRATALVAEGTNHLELITKYLHDEIKRSDLGMDFWIFWYNVISPVSLGRADVLEPILQRYCDELDNDVTMLRVEDKGIAIGRDGPVMGLPPQVVSETQVSCE